MQDGDLWKKQNCILQNEQNRILQSKQNSIFLKKENCNFWNEKKGILWHKNPVFWQMVFFSYFQQNERMTHIWHNGILKASKISKKVLFIQS